MVSGGSLSARQILGRLVGDQRGDAEIREHQVFAAVGLGFKRNMVDDVGWMASAGFALE